MEAHGISTVVVFLLHEIAEQVGVPRGLSVKFPFGHPLGEPHNVTQQMLLIRQALNMLETATEPMLIALPYRWKRENWGELAQNIEHRT